MSLDEDIAERHNGIYNYANDKEYIICAVNNMQQYNIHFLL